MMVEELPEADEARAHAQRCGLDFEEAGVNLQARALHPAVDRQG